MLETTIHTQHSGRFPKHEKTAVLGILAKGGLHEFFLIVQKLEWLESVIFCVE